MKEPDKVNDWLLALVCQQLRTFRGAPLTPRTVRAMMESLIETTGCVNDQDPAETTEVASVGVMLRRALELEILREQEAKEKADAE
jgi:hypothetical protein